MVPIPSMEQEASDELLSPQGHCFELAPVFAIPVAESDPAVLNLLEAMVGDSHPMGIGPQVIQDLLRTGERLLGIDHPTLCSRVF